MKILVIRFSSLGDVIIATSLFSYLKNTFPASCIHFLTDARYAGLFKDDPRLDAVTGADKSLGYACRRLPPDVRWDMVIDLQNNKRSAQVKKRLRVATAPGVFQKQYRKRMLLLFTRLNFYDPDDSVAKRYIKAAGAEHEAPVIIPTPILYVDDKESERLYRSLFSKSGARPLIALMPFSAWKNKEWMRRNFIVVGRFFLARGWDVAILGGPDDRRDAIDLQQGVGPPSRSLAGELTLYECACILKRCSLAVGNDTGLSHLARACGTKTGVIFGSTTSHFGFFPFGDPPFKVFQTVLICRPCHPHGGNICILRSRPCLSRILPETVIQGLEELYNTNYPAQ
jgi:heptosyltransferase II